MNFPRAVLRKVLPEGWKRQLKTLHDFGVLRVRDAIIVCSLVLAATMLETAGVAMVLPILEFVAQDGNLAAIDDKTGVWRGVTVLFGLLGLDVSLGGLCLTVVVLITLRQLAMFARTVAVSEWKERSTRDLALRCFDAVLGARGPFVERYGQGQFLELLNQQCNQAGNLLMVYTTLVALLVTIAAYAVLVLVTAPLASVLAMSFVVALLISMNHFVRQAGALSERTLGARVLYTGYAAERYRGWRLIKLSNTLGREHKGLAALADAVYRARVALARNSAVILLLMSPVMMAAAMGGLYVSVTYLGLSVSMITLFILVLLRLIPVAQALTSKRQMLAVGGAALDRVRSAVYQGERQKERDSGRKEFETVRNAIEFKSVSFEYEGEQRRALENVTATVPAGKVTAIVGPSGAGKSTLVSLIPRLTEATSGEVAIDGTTVSDFSLHSLRRRIAFVSQTPFLFSASVADNLRYTNPTATPAEFEEACRLARAHDFIMAMPEGYDSVLGEDGVRLSGGERQRLVLARALLSGARIMVLDEPTSALDFKSEREIKVAMESIVAAGNITTIIIAHRTSTIRDADHLIIMEGGKVVREGRPDALNTNESWYQQMLAAESA